MCRINSETSRIKHHNPMCRINLVKSMTKGKDVIPDTTPVVPNKQAELNTTRPKSSASTCEAPRSDAYIDLLLQITRQLLGPSWRMRVANGEKLLNGGEKLLNVGTKKSLFPQRQCRQASAHPISTREEP
uniref:Uncharacterized protein n=1 Tax=Triticum urartu TaxID=4572 RepID=A0A8R7TSS9_TRIUA